MRRKEFILNKWNCLKFSKAHWHFPQLDFINKGGGKRLVLAKLKIRFNSLDLLQYVWPVLFIRAEQKFASDQPNIMGRWITVISYREFIKITSVQCSPGFLQSDWCKMENTDCSWSARLSIFHLGPGILQVVKAPNCSDWVESYYL